MARTNQGGSILGFVIVGIVLASLLVGGIYLVNRQTTQSPPAVQEPQKPAEDKPQTPPPAEPGSGQPGRPSETQSVPTAGMPSGSAVELPATGPKETFGTLIVLGLLSAVAMSYVRSRRPQLSL